MFALSSDELPGSKSRRKSSLKFGTLDGNIDEGKLSYSSHAVKKGDKMIDILRNLFFLLKMTYCG